MLKSNKTKKMRGGLKRKELSSRSNVRPDYGEYKVADFVQDTEVYYTTTATMQPVIEMFNGTGVPQFTGETIAIWKIEFMVEIIANPDVGAVWPSPGYVQSDHSVILDNQWDSPFGAWSRASITKYGDVFANASTIYGTPTNEWRAPLNPLKSERYEILWRHMEEAAEERITPQTVACQYSYGSQTNETPPGVLYTTTGVYNTPGPWEKHLMTRSTVYPFNDYKVVFEDRAQPIVITFRKEMVSNGGPAYMGYKPDKNIFIPFWHSVQYGTLPGISPLLLCKTRTRLYYTDRFYP